MNIDIRPGTRFTDGVRILSYWGRDTIDRHTKQLGLVFFDTKTDECVTLTVHQFKLLTRV